MSKSTTRAGLPGVPEKPTYGNYIVVGQNTWATSECLSEALERWAQDASLRGQLAVIDASDDFRISHLDGGVSASELDTVFQQE